MQSEINTKNAFSQLIPSDAGALELEKRRRAKHQKPETLEVIIRVNNRFCKEADRSTYHLEIKSKMNDHTVSKYLSISARLRNV